MADSVNEDETYRALIRVDFETLYRKVKSMSIAEFREVYKSAADKAVFFNKYGWTTVEFEEAYKNREFPLK